MELDGVEGPPALFGLTNKMKKTTTKKKGLVHWVWPGFRQKPPTGQCPKKRSMDGWTDRGTEGMDG